jgi:hypothetical protein
MSRPPDRESFERRRRGRNLALLAALLAVVALLYVIAFVRVGNL